MSPLQELLGPPAGAPSAPPPTPATDTDSRAEAVVRLGRALHEAGSPAHRIEEGMQVAAERLGLDGQFFSTPTALFASFTGAGRERQTVLERVEPAEVDLERLDLLDRLFAALAAREAGPREVIERVDALLARVPRYTGWPTVAAYGLVASAAAFFFRGGWPEIAASAVMGLLIGTLAGAAHRLAALERLFAPVAAFVAAFLVTGAVALGAPLSASAVILSGMIVLIPGLTLTVSFTELATRQLVSGSARLAGALVLFLTLAFGVGLGSLVAQAALGAAPELAPVPPAAGWKWLFVAVAALGLTLLFRASLRDLGWVFLAGALAVQTVEVGARFLGPQLGAFAGALAVGIAGNLFARAWHRPAALVHMPGLIMLVPGSLGFRSLAQLMHEDVLTGLETAFDATLVGISLATGLLLSSVVIPPRRVL